MRVHNRIWVKLEFHPVVRCQYCLNSQEIYSMQQNQPVSNIPTTPAIVTVSQVQVQPIVCQPQVSQVIIQ